MLKSARDGDELRTGTNKRALLSALASGRAKIDSIGQREGCSEGIKEEMMDRLQPMVQVALQKGGDLIISSIPYSWRERCVQRVLKASGIIDLITPAVTINDWSFQDCQDYLVELEMAKSGAIMALRWTGNDINSSHINHQVKCLSSQAERQGT